MKSGKTPMNKHMIEPMTLKRGLPDVVNRINLHNEEMYVDI